MADMHIDFNNQNFRMENKLCPFCCRLHKMAEHFGVWYCTSRPLTQGGLSEKNLNLISGNMQMLADRATKEIVEKNQILESKNSLDEAYKELGDKYISLKEKLGKEKDARVASDRKAAHLENNRDNEEAFMSNLSRRLGAIARNIEFLTVK
jgi:ribosomal protein S27AE